MRTLVSMLALLLLAFAPGCGDEEEGPDHFSSTLREVNDSGVRGTVRYTLDGDELTVAANVRGLEPFQTHDTAIQGVAGAGRSSRCPDDAESPVLLKMEPRPSTKPGQRRLQFRLKYRVDREAIEPLTNHVFVFKGGKTGPGAVYDPRLPVACGRIVSAKTGPG